MGEGRDAKRIDELHHPEWMLRDDLNDYPAHLHIALAPEVQGKGAGRALMDTYLAALRARGVSRVHLAMSTANTGAHAFYERLGFDYIAQPAPACVLLGRRTHPLPP
jgi:ribosomal protein S18 acetylase RimI-like enzyme